MIRAGNGRCWVIGPKKPSKRVRNMFLRGLHTAAFSRLAIRQACSLVLLIAGDKRKKKIRDVMALRMHLRASPKVNMSHAENSRGTEERFDGRST